MGSHTPRFYLLSSADKGKYLLDKGDAELESKNIGKAIKYFKDARKYCNDEAQKRLERCGQSLSLKNNTSSTQSTKLVTQQLKLKLTGPYFLKLSAPSSISIASSPSTTSPTQDIIEFSIYSASSTLDLANRYNHANDEEKKKIRVLLDNIIQKYDENSRSKEYIQELAMLAAIPDQQIFITIINQLLKVEKDSPTLPEHTIHGLAVILTCAPKEIDFKDRQGLLTDILERLQYRLGKTRTENNNEELLPLLRAITALFDAMLCRGLKHLGRVDVYNPIKDRLTELGLDSDVDTEVSFLARYAIQSLAYIGNDESLAMSIFRRGRLAIGIIADIKTAVLEFNIMVFESIYEKVMSMRDNSVEMEWYQGLLFLDCLLSNDDLSNFEKFVLESKLNSDEDFMQGVCFRLEQLASLHSNQQTTLGAREFLQDLESNLVGRTQVTARLVLNRLRIFSGGSTASSSNVNSSTPRTDADFQQFASERRLTPVWSKVWCSDMNSFLLKSVQDTLKQESSVQMIGPALLDVGSKLDTILPTLNSMDEVNMTLMDHYSNKLTIRRVSGELLNLESCYINLAIVEAVDQRKKDAEDRKKQSESFIRMPSFEQLSNTNTDKPIPLEEILDERKLLGGKKAVPNRILIIGRAGIGKTTFCKKLVHTFQSGKWSDRFDTILWLPLRLLQEYNPRDLEQFLFEKFFTRGVKNKREGLVREFIKSAEKGRVLFVLDGLDEFVTETNTEVGSPLRNFLEILLQQTNVIITTRPHGNDRSLIGNVDLELETIGFSAENVKQYVESVITSQDEVDSVLEFVHQTPLIQGLVNIPIQLDLICFSWKGLAPTGNKTTISQLYQQIVQKLWCNDAIRMRKDIGNKPATESLIKCLSKRKIDSYMAKMVEYLGYLAFRGLTHGHQIIFSHDTLVEAMEELDLHRTQTGQPEFPVDFLEEVKKSSILHTTNEESECNSDTSQDTWNFIHLTFQEYFAASWLSKYFQSKLSASSNTSILMNIDETIAFIQQNKYNPRYEIVWWMIAGHLEGEALESYFHLLQGAPRDLIGVRHQLLIAGCYKEAQSRLSPNLVQQIHTELTQWLRFEMTFEKDNSQGSVIGRQYLFPDEILFKIMDESEDNTRRILNTFYNRRNLASSTIAELIRIASDNESKFAYVALSALRNQVTPPSETLNTLFHMALHDGKPQARVEAVKALWYPATLSESAENVIAIALEDKDTSVRIEAARAFCNHLARSESTMAALVEALGDMIWPVRRMCAIALSIQPKLSEFTIRGILEAISWHDSSRDQYTVINILSKKSDLSESAIERIIAYLEDYEPSIRCVAIEILGNQPTLSESTMARLFDTLQDQSLVVRFETAIVLEKHSVFSASMIKENLQDNDWHLREAAVYVLGLQSTLSESEMMDLVVALQDTRPNVGIAAAKALGSQTTLSESSIAALVTALEDENWYLRSTIVNTLGNQSTFSETTAAALVLALQDDKPYVRNEAAFALGKKSDLPESSVAALIATLQDEDYFVRQRVINALGNQSVMSETIIAAVVNTLQDSMSGVREVACNILSNQSTLSESTVTALVTALQSDEIEEAVRALGKQSALPTSTVSQIFTIKKEKDILKCLGGMLRTPKFHFSVKDLTENEIEKYYKHVIYRYSCDHHVSLFIHDSRLHVYTEQGSDRSEVLSPEVLHKIESAFLAVQKLVE